MVAFPRLFEVLKNCLYKIFTQQRHYRIYYYLMKIKQKLSQENRVDQKFIPHTILLVTPTHAHDVCWSHLTNSTVTVLAYHLHDVIFKYDSLSLLTFSILLLLLCMSVQLPITATSLCSFKNGLISLAIRRVISHCDHHQFLDPIEGFMLPLDHKILL